MNGGHLRIHVTDSYYWWTDWKPRC